MKMMDHPNIIKYTECYEDERYMYIVTEYIPQSEDLKEISKEQVKKRNQRIGTLFPENDIRNIMRMIFYAMNHIHANNVVHRDIKPANILIDANNQIKIIDFGLAIDVENLEKEPKRCTDGTKLFMAPEILLNRGRIQSYK